MFSAFAPGTTEIFRLYNTSTGSHLFTEDPAVKNAVLAQFPGVWVQHTSLGFAFPSPASELAAARSAPALSEILRSLGSDPRTAAATSSASSIVTWTTDGTTFMPAIRIDTLLDRTNTPLSLEIARHRGSPISVSADRLTLPRGDRGHLRGASATGLPQPIHRVDALSEWDAVFVGLADGDDLFKAR